MKTWSIIELLQETRLYFERCGIASARLDAEILLAHALDKNRITLYIDFEEPVAPEALSRFRELVRRRAHREPVAYITGYKEFWSLRLQVDRTVLIPRPETEVLVDAALKLLRADEQPGTPQTVLDLGTGSGAIALALAKETERARVVALDRSLPALRVARANSNAYAFGKRVHAVCGDGAACFAAPETFDLIAANPPYIATDALEHLEPEIKGFEPREALDGGSDGLAFYRAWIPRMPGLLKRRGWVALEIGEDQADAVAGMFQADTRYTGIHAIRDFAQKHRVILAQKQS